VSELFDPALLLKYSQAGPRYTSYPTAPAFSAEFGEREYRELLSKKERQNTPLSLYFHIPFCESVCYFCACSVIYTRIREKADPYIDLVIAEMDLVQQSLDKNRPVEQLHWGGGTPTFLAPEKMGRFFQEIRKRFSFSPDAEISVELDPREVKEGHIQILRESGFNRASIGVQDLDDAVQKAIHRIQPFEMSAKVVHDLRAAGFQGVNIDLIYGLPLQTRESFSKTIDGVLSLRPDRFSLFNFAYLPWLKKHQRLIHEEDLPDSSTRLDIFRMAVERFLDAGYVYIGMDHFALPDDELCRAQENGTLHRNFQGYTTKGGLDLIGFGLTSIGELADAYAQNHKDMVKYREAVRAGHLPVERGLILSEDDRIRKAVIMDLINHFRLDKAKIEREFQINFDEYFREDMNSLSGFIKDGLIVLNEDGISVSRPGRFVIRNICMAFDAHLRTLQEKGQRFSRTV